MQRIECKLTVFFDDPFWVGIFERVTDGKLEVCKITFGSEPKDYEVYDYLLQYWNNLRFSPPVNADTKLVVKINPKRMQRVIKKLETHRIGTKSQQALKLQQVANKTSRKEKSRKRKEDEKQRQFALRRQRRKEKHRGR